MFIFHEINNKLNLKMSKIIIIQTILIKKYKKMSKTKILQLKSKKIQNNSFSKR